MSYNNTNALYLGHYIYSVHFINLAAFRAQVTLASQKKKFAGNEYS